MSRDFFARESGCLKAVRSRKQIFLIKMPKIFVQFNYTSETVYIVFY